MNDTHGTEIILNVYYLGDTEAMKKSQFLAPLGMGLYHSGVEINGSEYCYGGDPNNPGHGVMQMTPCSIAGAVYH